VDRLNVPLHEPRDEGASRRSNGWAASLLANGV
jgi:hypothetical protein